MRIRDEQRKAFSEPVVHEFKGRIGVQLHKCFPKHHALASGHRVEDKSS